MFFAQVIQHQKMSCFSHHNDDFGLSEEDFCDCGQNACRQHVCHLDEKSVDQKSRCRSCQQNEKQKERQSIVKQVRDWTLFGNPPKMPEKVDLPKFDRSYKDFQRELKNEFMNDLKTFPTPKPFLPVAVVHPESFEMCTNRFNFEGGKKWGAPTVVIQMPRLENSFWPRGIDDIVDLLQLENRFTGEDILRITGSDNFLLAHAHGVLANPKKTLQFADELFMFLCLRMGVAQFSAHQIVARYVVQSNPLAAFNACSINARRAIAGLEWELPIPICDASTLDPSNTDLHHRSTHLLKVHFTHRFHDLKKKIRFCRVDQNSNNSVDQDNLVESRDNCHTSNNLIQLHSTVLDHDFYSPHQTRGFYLNLGHRLCLSFKETAITAICISICVDKDECKVCEKELTKIAKIDVEFGGYTRFSMDGDTCAKLANKANLPSFHNKKQYYLIPLYNNNENENWSNAHLINSVGLNRESNFVFTDDCRLSIECEKAGRCCEVCHASILGLKKKYVY